jgi:hypothetical protein
MVAPLQAVDIGSSFHSTPSFGMIPSPRGSLQILNVTKLGGSRETISIGLLVFLSFQENMVLMIDTHAEISMLLLGHDLLC